MPSLVLLVGQHLQMIRINARPELAHVMQFLSFHILPTGDHRPCKLVREHPSIYAVPRLIRIPPVSSPLANPFPTGHPSVDVAALLVHIGKEVCFRVDSRVAELLQYPRVRGRFSRLSLPPFLAASCSKNHSVASDSIYWSKSSCSHPITTSSPPNLPRSKNTHG